MSNNLRLARYLILAIVLSVLGLALFSILYFIVAKNTFTFVLLCLAFIVALYWIERTLGGYLFHRNELKQIRKMFKEHYPKKSILYDLRSTPCGKIESDILCEEFDVNLED